MGLLWSLLPFISVSTWSCLSVSELRLSLQFSAPSAFCPEELRAGSAALGFAGTCLPAALFPSTVSIFTRQRVCSRPIASKFSSEYWSRLLKSSNTWRDQTKLRWGHTHPVSFPRLLCFNGSHCKLISIILCSVPMLRVSSCVRQNWSNIQQQQYFSHFPVALLQN